MTQNNVHYPEWKCVEEAEAWFLELRIAVRSVVYNWDAALEGDFIGDAVYFTPQCETANRRNLERVLHKDRDFWFGFNGQEEMTPGFLREQKFLQNSLCASTPEQLPKCTG